MESNFVECPGSAYFNYKNFHSMVLAICDARYTFTMVDIGGYGRDNDAAIFSESSLGQLFDSEMIQLPQPELVNRNLRYILVGNAISP